MPLLFQRPVGLENRPIPISGIRDLLAGALTAARLTGIGGQPLDFAPHDFRHYADSWVMRPAVTFPLAGAAGLVLLSA